MPERLSAFFDYESFIPHGHCYLWLPEILWLHVASDALIVLAYYSIPLGILYYAHKRKTLPFPELFYLFGAFIFLCGTTHIMEIIVVWQPYYGIEGILKALTGLVSIITAYWVWRAMPYAMQLRTPAEFERINQELRKGYALTERKVEERTAELAALVTEYQVIMNTVLDGLIVIDEHGLIQNLNPAAMRIFGYAREEVTSKNVSMLMPEPYRSEHDGYLRNYHETGIAKIIGIGREITAMRKDGSVFPMELGVNAMQIHGKRMFVGTIRDISERKQAETYRKKLVDQLMRSNTELERFAYVASHDMQEPLRMVVHFSEILQTDYANRFDKEGREYLQLIVDAGKRMQEMVNDLLEYSRISSAKMQKPVDGAQELRHVLDNLRAYIREHNAHITYDTLPVFYGNPVQFMRLLQNLLINAIKYQPPGQQPQVHIGVEDQGTLWRIGVKDNGIGIEEDFVKQVFEPFRRLHTWDAIEGTGLGLAVCKRVVENHGGTIWVTSIRGEGSVFYFTLPKYPHTQSEVA